MSAKKNLVLGLAKGYNWYILEPFIRSFVKNVHSADLVLFIDDYSDFTRAQLEKVGKEIQGGALKLEPVPETLKERFPANSRWKVFADYIEVHGDEYEQIFLSDTRDVVFQSDLFDYYKGCKKFLACAYHKKLTDEMKFFKNPRVKFIMPTKSNSEENLIFDSYKNSFVKLKARS